MLRAGRRSDQKPEVKSPSCRTGKDYRVLAERSVRTGKQELAIDRDGRVLLLSVTEGGRIAEMESLGYEHQGSVFPSASSLPKDEAVMLVRRISCSDQNWTLWVAQTLGFEEPQKRKGMASLEQHVFVFREGDLSVKNPVLTETFREITDLTVDDVNGDQRAEIVVQYADEDAGSWMKIWQVDLAGTLHAVPLDDLKRDLTSVPGQVEIGLGDYRHGGELLFTEQRLQTSKGWHVTRRYYDWDEAKQRYELSEVVQSEEIISK
jgi:hypothetical protein